MRCLVAGAMLVFALNISATNLPDVPEGLQALTLPGKPLYPAEPGKETLEQLAEARNNYEADPNDANNIIWYGRRTAYAGDYRNEDLFRSLRASAAAALAVATRR